MGKDELQHSVFQGVQSKTGIPPLNLLITKRTKLDPLPPKLLCLNPGETTGWAIFERGKLVRCGQLVSTIPGVPQFIVQEMPSHVVYEDFVLYAHKAQDQQWSKMNTSRVIGAIEYVCWELGIPYYEQVALEGKSFVTDDKLKAWDLYQTGQRHARDAIRHGIAFMLFGEYNHAKRDILLGSANRTVAMKPIHATTEEPKGGEFSDS